MIVLKRILSVILMLLIASSIAFSGERLDTVLNNKVIRVGTPGDYRPFSMAIDGGYEGFDIDIINKIAEILNVKVEFVPTTWSKLQDDLAANKYDVAIGGITRNVTRISRFTFLPGYAPVGKVALIRAEDKNKYTSLESINKPNVRVIKNPGGSNERFVLANLPNADVSTHEKNAEIPALIAEGKGDVMITETYEALLYARKDSRLHAAFVDKPLTKANTLGFMLQKDDADFVRIMNFLWETLALRGELDECVNKWLK
jgi:cyclohexadienyl dehydratase